jgi:NAD(P)H-dependent FMN reductase
MDVISVVVGSTREGRFSEKLAKWIHELLKKREDVDARLLDLREFPMSFFDQKATPATPLDWQYPEWNRKAAAFVGYGSALGGRGIQQLRLALIAPQMAPIRTSLHILSPP